MTSSLCESSVPTAISCSSGFQIWVRLTSIGVIRAFLRRPSLRPSAVASTSPPAPPPTITMCCNEWAVAVGRIVAGRGCAGGSSPATILAVVPPCSIAGALIALSLPHGRHDEVGTLADAGGPARGDGLQARVEAHPLRPVHV